MAVWGLDPSEFLRASAFERMIMQMIVREAADLDNRLWEHRAAKIAHAIWKSVKF